MNMMKRWSVKLTMGLAVACALVANAHAQSSVTLYGLLDAGVLYTSKTPNATGRNAGASYSFVNAGFNPSQIGIKGSEDLGNGYQAIFNLQSGIDLGTGGFDNNTAGSFFGRQAWVGLDSRYGTLKLGMQFSAFEVALADSDPRDFSQLGSAITLYSANIPTGTFSSNEISYTSPKIDGFQTELMAGLGGVAGDFKAGAQYSARLAYEVDGFSVNAGFLDEPAASGTAITNPAYAFTMPVIAKTLGMGYHFSTITVRASYTTFKAPDLPANPVDGNNDIYNVGFDWHVSSFFETNAGVWYIRDPHSSANHALQIALGGMYSLSKRTTLYSQIAAVNNCGAERIGPTMENGDLYGVSGTTIGVDIGIKHVF